MSKENNRLGKDLWRIADSLRGQMDADDFKDYMLGFIFFKFLSDNYEKKANEILENDKITLEELYKSKDNNLIQVFEREIIKKIGYKLPPELLWKNLIKKAKSQDGSLIDDTNKIDLQHAFRAIEDSTIGQNSEEEFSGLFNELDLYSIKLGKYPKDKEETLRKIMRGIEEILEAANHKNYDSDKLGDAYEYLIAQFASNSGKKAGEFYTPQNISKILSKIVSLDYINPENKKEELKDVYDPTCGSGSLLINVYKEMKGKIFTIYGQEKNVTTYNLARMNMLLHNIKYDNFQIRLGDTLKNPEFKGKKFKAIVANPPFSLRWEAQEHNIDDRFRTYSLPPRNSADFAFILHMLYHLDDDEGTMAVIVPHGVLFRGGSEKSIREALLSINNNGYLDAVIGLAPNLFYSTSIPVCILVFKKCRQNKDILFIDASRDFKKGKNQNIIEDEHIEKIIETFQKRREEEKYSRRVDISEIKENDYNLNISRYIDSFEEESEENIEEIITKLKKTLEEEKEVNKQINQACKELGIESPILDKVHKDL